MLEADDIKGVPSMVASFFQSLWLRCCGWRRVSTVVPVITLRTKGLTFHHYRVIWYRETSDGVHYFRGPTQLDLWVDGQRVCRTLRGEFAVAVFDALVAPSALKAT